jgi:SHS2 domain-containing protein
MSGAAGGARAKARFEFLDAVTSDLCVKLLGDTLEDVFAALAEALLAATVLHPEAVGARERRPLDLDAADLERLLVRFANELIFARDADGLLLRAERVAVESDGRAHLHAELVGERLDPARHGAGADVKAATLHGLALSRTDAGGFEARLTFDV